MSSFIRVSLLLVGCFVMQTARGLEILGDPAFRYVAPHQLQIRWQTDQPSDSRVDYGNPPNMMTAANPAPVTDHIILIQNLQPGRPYNYFISSIAGGETAEAEDFLFEAPMPVVIQEPAARPGEQPPLVSGEVTIVVGAVHPSIQINSITFLFVPPGGGQPMLIGTDADGAGVIVNTFQEAVTGDGWSVDWDTTNLPAGAYRLIAQCNTSIGQLQATSDVFLDQHPPQPGFVAPQFGDTVRGDVRMRAEGGQGNEARFEVRGPVGVLLSFSPVGLSQTNYPFDGNRGQMMCDPTSQAAILLSLPRFREALLANPAFQRALRRCTNSAPPEECIRRLLIKVLAQQKGTGRSGTSRDGELAGSNAILQGLGLPWHYERKKDKKKNNQSYTVAELKACANMPHVLGVVVHIHPCGNMTGTGHAMALKEINDRRNADGTFTVTFMDPATGTDASFSVSANGSFSYGGTMVCIRSMGMFMDTPPDRFVQLAGSPWQVIGVDTDGADGWEALWSPAGLPSGFYWLHVVLTDEGGRSGEDFTEVFLAPPLLRITRSGDNVIVRWPAQASNYDLQFTSDLTTDGWSPVMTPVVVDGEENTVQIGISPGAQFLRLQER